MQHYTSPFPGSAHWASLWGRPQRWPAKGACATPNKKEEKKLLHSKGNSCAEQRLISLVYHVNAVISSSLCECTHWNNVCTIFDDGYKSAYASTWLGMIVYFPNKMYSKQDLWYATTLWGKKNCTLLCFAITLSNCTVFWYFLAHRYLNKFATKLQQNCLPTSPDGCFYPTLWYIICYSVNNHSLSVMYDDTCCFW